MSSIVRTVLGDVDVADLGITYPHEHLILDNALIEAAFPHILLDDAEVTAREVAECRSVGVTAMVDAMPCAAGRDVLRLVEVSRATGVHVIAVTGLHHPRYYGPRHWTARVSAEELGSLFADDVMVGVDEFDYSGPVVRRSPHRAGLIKIATGGEALGPRDELLIEAAAIAHHRSGAPILSHCEHGRGALEQVDALARHGVPADAVLLSHIDKVLDPGYHAAIAATGAWLLFDQPIRHHRNEVGPTTPLIARLVADGHGDRLLVSTDGARRSLWHAYHGAPGLAWLAGEYAEQLRAYGIGAAVVEDLFTRNPASALTLRANGV